MLLPSQTIHSDSRLRPWQTFYSIFFACLACIFSPFLWALDSDRLQPLEIIADSVELNEGEGFSNYSGNVLITQGNMKIEASQVKVTFNADGIQTMLAKEGLRDGLAYMRQQSEPSADGQNEVMEAWGKSIDYQVNAEYLTLIGNAKLIQQGNTFSGYQILFDIPENNVKATGGQGKRVNMIFLPKSK